MVARADLDKITIIATYRDTINGQMHAKHITNTPASYGKRPFKEEMDWTITTLTSSMPYTKSIPRYHLFLSPSAHTCVLVSDPMSQSSLVMDADDGRVVQALKQDGVAFCALDGGKMGLCVLTPTHVWLYSWAWDTAVHL
jgi:hypothetical protein